MEAPTRIAARRPLWRTGAQHAHRERARGGGDALAGGRRDAPGAGGGGVLWVLLAGRVQRYCKDWGAGAVLFTLGYTEEVWESET